MHAARSVVFALCSTILLPMVVGCGASSSTDKPSSIPPSEESTTEATPAALAEATKNPNAYPSFGVIVPKPVGWHIDPQSPQAGFVARWLANNDSDKSWAQFTVNVAPQRGRNPSQAGRVWRQRGYEPSDVKLAGAQAVRLDLPSASHPNQPQPSPIVIALKNGLLYTTFFLLDDDTPPGFVDEVLAGWEWSEVQPVALCLRLGEPVAVFGGVGTLRLPKPARLDPALSSDTIAAYLAFDYSSSFDGTSGQDGWLVSLERIDQATSDLEKAAIDYAKQIEDRTGINELLRFRPLADTPHVMACEPLKGTFPDGAGGIVTRLTSYAVWQPTAETLIRMQFVINDEVVIGDEQTARALRAIDAVLRSCSTSDKK